MGAGVSNDLDIDKTQWGMAGHKLARLAGSSLSGIFGGLGPRCRAASTDHGPRGSMATVASRQTRRLSLTSGASERARGARQDDAPKEGRFAPPEAVPHDAAGIPKRCHVLERIAIQKHQVRSAASGDRADLRDLAEKDRATIRRPP